MAKDDLKGFTNPSPLDWSDAGRAASLDTLFARVHAETSLAIDWYFPKPAWRKRFAQMARGGAILCFTLAGLQPLVASMHHGDATNDCTWLPLHPAWATLFVALAAALLAFDYYSGLSKGWIRYVTTGLQLKQMLDGFAIACEQDRAGWARQAPTDEQLRASLVRCSAFIQQVDDVVRDETKAWAEDFVESLQQLGSAVKAAQAARATGSIQVTVSNGDKTEKGWTLSIDGTPTGASKTGISGSVTGLAPRTHTVVVEGTIANKAVRAEQAIMVTAETITSIVLELR